MVKKSFKDYYDSRSREEEEEPYIDLPGGICNAELREWFNKVGVSKNGARTFARHFEKLEPKTLDVMAEAIEASKDEAQNTKTKREAIENEITDLKEAKQSLGDEIAEIGVSLKSKQNALEDLL